MKLYTFNEKTLDFERVRTPWIWRTLFIISCLFLLSSSFVEKEYVPTEAIILKETKTEEEVFEMVDRMPFKYPDIIKAQILLETGHLTSEVYKHNNNLFGMRVAKQRLTLAKGENLKHAYFESLEDCIIDRLVYEAKYLNNLNREQYFDFLDRLYAEGDNYSNKLKQIIENNENFKSSISRD